MTKITLLVLGAILVASHSTIAQNVDLLTLPAITWDAPTGGGLFRISQMSACNGGADAVTSDFDVSLILKNEDTDEIFFIATQTVTNPNLTQNTCSFVYNLQGYILDAPVTVPDGVYQWGAWVDSGEDFSEADEQNNFRFIGTYNHGVTASLFTESIKNDFNIYPNPAIDFVTIETEFSEDIIGMKLINPNGQTIYEAEGFNASINISQLENGIYFIQLATNEVITTKRMVIQH